MERQQRKIHVVGINSSKFQDLSLIIQELLLKTRNIAIPKSYFEELKDWFNDSIDKKTLYKSNSDFKLIDWLKNCKMDAILISRGDPLWYGIGRVLLDNFSKNELLFYPSNTCLQMAFSKLKKPWQNVNCTSIHGRDSNELIRLLKLKVPTLVIIPDSKNNGLNLIRKNLIELQLESYYEFWVFENLGHENEKIRMIKIIEKLPEDISDLNLVVLSKSDSHSYIEKYPLFGLKDNLFKTFSDRPNLITKREIRIQILADLELPEEGTLWDIGAGSGTIGLEALKLRPKLKLVAIDKRFGTKEMISENAKRLDVIPSKIFEKDIKELLELGFSEDLGEPNRIVIGGCNQLTKIFIIKKLTSILNKGDIIVIPLVTYEVLQEIQKIFEELKYEVNLNLIQTFKGISISEGTRFEPNNPVFLIKGKKLM
tara:strand:- start:1761 stop:3038 length:1278 start_codon:yes stop_codon:yes gene_type:complete